MKTPPLTTGATVPWAAVLDWTKGRKWAECECTPFSASWLWAQCGLKTATMIDTVTWFMTGDPSARMDYVLELWAKNKPSSEFFWWSILSRQWDRTLIQFPTELEIWPSCPCSWLRPYHFIWNVTFKKTILMGCCWAQWGNDVPSLIKVLASISGPMDECSVSQGSDCIRKCLSRVCNSLQTLWSFSRMMYFVLLPLEADTSAVVKRFKWNVIFLRGEIYLT